MDEVMKRHLRIFLISFVILLSFRAQSSEPDFKKEERFHNIYKKYNEHPTSSEDWEKVLSNRKTNAYTIQKDDTLWDISQTFFGDSNYWPKVWSYNTEGILNPHEINPGKNVRFYAGTLEEPPAVGLVAKDAIPESIPDQIIEKRDDGSVEAIKIPPPKRKSRPLVKNLPDSLPLYRLGAVNAPPLQYDSNPLPKIPPPQKFLTIYAVETEIVPVGEIVEIEIEDGEAASDFQYVTVRLAKASEKNLVAYEDSNRLKDPFSSSSATLIEIQGELEVMSRVSDSDSLFRAMVKKGVAPVKRGAKLMPGAMQKFEVKSTPPSTTVQARIIGGEPYKYQKIFGDAEIIFLSAGEKEGLREGMDLQVYMNERERKKDTKTTTNDRVIGLVKIIKTSDHFATAYVLNSETNFVIGDYAGGQVKSSASSGSNDLDGSEKADTDLDLDSMKDAPPADDDLQL